MDCFVWPAPPPGASATGLETKLSNYRARVRSWSKALLNILKAVTSCLMAPPGVSAPWRCISFTPSIWRTLRPSARAIVPMSVFASPDLLVEQSHLLK